MTPVVYLYDEGTAPTLDVREAGRFLERALAVGAECRPEFVGYHGGDTGALAPAFARCKVRDPLAPRASDEPMYGEVEFERRRLASGNRGPHGVLYEGFEFQAVLRDLIPPAEASPRHVHIVLTNRLLVTWVDAERRFHLRTVICGAPGIVSTSGLVEAPAKPREFHLGLQALGQVSSDDPAYLALRARFRERVLEHEDDRLTEVAKGYALQAALYSLAGEGFCPEPRCRLHDAHQQDDMLAAQTGEPGLCPGHERLIGDLRQRWGG